MNEFRIHRDVRIPTEEPGVTLSGDLYLPVVDGPVPALLTVSPYRKDASIGIPYDPELRWFAARGYAALLVDLLGTGSSDGVLRAPVDLADAEDGLAAVAWAASQPWCTGSIGMWGQSYGSMTAMGTATHNPEHLRAIVAVQGPIDPEWDSIHPNGTRGGQCPVPTFGRLTLVDQLLPPLEKHHSPQQQQRWRDRLEDAESWVLDLFHHGPNDPVWRERVIDAAKIRVPALCVGGWRDMQLEGQVRAYELMQGPKKLLVGPWLHVHPQQSPVAPIDFLPMVLRFWDFWLRGIDNGVMDEPPVTVFVQGLEKWRTYDSWPPAPDRLRLDSTRVLTIDGSREYRPDPTIGALEGLWGIGSPFGLPLDQTDDDRRSLCATGEPLADDLLVAGRPRVVVNLEEGSRAERFVVRLNDVDRDGGSTFVTSGVSCGGEPLDLYPDHLPLREWSPAARRRLRRRVPAPLAAARCAGPARRLDRARAPDRSPEPRGTGGGADRPRSRGSDSQHRGPADLADHAEPARRQHRGGLRRGMDRENVERRAHPRTTRRVPRDCPPGRTRGRGHP